MAYQPPIEETLVHAMERLRTEGFDRDFFATEDGRLKAHDAEIYTDPADMHIDHQLRFEGATNPGDATILLAITCDCGTKGLYATGYGPEADPEDAQVLRKLAARERAEREAGA